MGMPKQECGLDLQPLAGKFSDGLFRYFHRVQIDRWREQQVFQPPFEIFGQMGIAPERADRFTRFPPRPSVMPHGAGIPHLAAFLGNEQFERFSGGPAGPESQVMSYFHNLSRSICGRSCCGYLLS